MMKIVHILHSVGGVDVSLRLILENLDSSKFECIVVHGNEDTNSIFIDKDSTPIKEYKIPIHRSISIINDFKALIQVYRIIKKEDPALIHAHSTKGGIIGKVVGVLTRKRVLHTPQAFSFLSTSNPFKRNIFLFIEKMLTRKNVFLLACSESEKKRGIHEVGFKPENVLLFNNAIQPISKTPLLSIEKTWPENYICTVGRPCYQKNITEMIRVIYEVKKTQDIHLVVMGVGHHSDQLDEVKKMIIDLDLNKNITLLNWTSRTDVFHIISKSQLYISTARYEGLPYSVIEALALSKPCVVSDCDGNRDLIKDGYNGYVVKENNTYNFSAKIIELIENKDRYDEFSNNAHESFEKNYNIIYKISDLEAIYLE